MSGYSYFSVDDDAPTRSFELPGAKPHYVPDRPGQVQHIALDVALDFERQRLAGTCTITLNPIRDRLERLTLDAVDLAIESVAIAEVPQEFDLDGEQLFIHLSEPTVAGRAIAIVITYHLEKPRRGLYFIGPNEWEPDKPRQAWTQGEDEDSRYWFPCFDYPGQLATSEIRVRVPKGMTALSNGVLVSTQPHGKTATTFHWKQEQVHPSYLMTLAVGEFVEVRDEWRGKPVLYYTDAAHADHARRTMGQTPEMMEFLSEKFGYPYPFPQYGQACVADFIFGGMENTSMTLLTDRAVVDERAAIDNRFFESLVVHELAHQWFGDLLVIEHWSHAWIKEGMATYSEVMWIEREYGPQAAAYYRLGEMRAYLAEDRDRYRRPIVTHVYREAMELYDRHTYEKGGCVYHMLWAELGDDLFWKAIQYFVKTHAHQTVATVDLLRAIERATGRNLAYLFDQYVFRGGHPDYKVSYGWDGENNLAKVTVVQTQGDSGDRKTLFDLKIPVAFGFVETAAADGAASNGTKKGKGKGKAKEVEKGESGRSPVRFQTVPLQINEKEHVFYIPLAQKPDFVSFDAGNHTLKTVELDYPLAELKQQLAQDPDPIARIFAAQAIAKKGTLEAFRALETALREDDFWGVRVEIAGLLPDLAIAEVLDALTAALKDPKAQVRTAAVNAIARLKTPDAYKAIEPIAKKGDASYQTEAASLRAIGSIAAACHGTYPKPKREKAIALLETALKQRPSWNELVRSGAIGGLSAMNDCPEAADLILSYTALGTPQGLRLSAIRALGPVSIHQEAALVERILRRLDALSREEFFLTQMAAIWGLRAMKTTGAIALLSGLMHRSPDARVRRLAEEAIAVVQRNVGPQQNFTQLRQELDQLKQDNRTLKGRLEAIEAKEQEQAKAKANSPD
ncbi:MAG: M1 family metallopeptidase [Cyanophyceae cyanobacterium]